MNSVRPLKRLGLALPPKMSLAAGIALTIALLSLGYRTSQAQPAPAAVVQAPPGRLAGEANLGWTKAAHSLTRGHNRKVIYDATFNHWYIFWLRDDGKPEFSKDEEGVVYQVSSDGLTWSKPIVVQPFQDGGMTAFDVTQVGTRFYLLGLSDYVNPPSRLTKNGVRELNINPDGTLIIQPPQVVYDNSAGDFNTVHFYGSILRDSKGYFWVAARVGDASPGTHAEVIRSAAPDSIAAWGPKGTIGQACNDQWTNPYAKSKQAMLQGTIASRLLDLGPHGVGLVTYNKHNDDKRNDPGQLFFVRNPTRTHDGWDATSILLTNRANQYMRPAAAPDADKTRLDDRRYSAIVDPRTFVIHVIYIAADTATPESGNLRYFTISPPYTLADKSAETTLVAAETDGTHLSIDTRTNPSTLYVIYVANDHPNYQVRMIRNTGSGWSPAVNVSDGVGVVRYPQCPETIAKDEMVIAWQFTNKTPERSVYDTRAAKVILAPTGPK